MARISWSILLISAAWLISRPVQATPLLEQMGGFGDSGGQQARHLASGPSAAYFNPALLPDAPTGLTFGFVVLGSRIAISIGERAPGNDVPGGLANAVHADGTRWDQYPLATDLLQNGQEASASKGAIAARPRQGQGTGNQTLNYLAIGIVARFFDQKLAIGFTSLLPNRNLMTLVSHYPDEREQYFSNSLHPELYGDRLTSLAVGFGLGYRVHKTFSLGLGGTIKLLADADAPAFVESATKLDSLQLNIDTGVKAGLSLHGGFLWRPLPRLRFTGTVHGPQELAINSDVQFLLASGLEQTTSIKFLFDWMPWQVGFGASWDVVQHENTVLTLAGSAVYGRWSQYLDRHGENPASAFGWYDTITPAAGVRLTANKWRYGIDLQYKPTPVPLQQGRSNYVDNDRLGATQHLEYTIPIRDTKLTIGAQLQAFWLLDRLNKKIAPPTAADGVNRTPALVKDEVPDDAVVGGRAVPGAAGLQTNNPGWPGFRSQGWLITGGIYLAFTL